MFINRKEKILTSHSLKILIVERPPQKITLVDSTLGITNSVDMFDNSDMIKVFILVHSFQMELPCDGGTYFRSLVKKSTGVDHVIDDTAFA